MSAQRFTDHEITEAMIVFGGGFVSQLGKLFRQGDAENRKILKEAFAIYWKEYSDPLMHARLAQVQR